MARKEAAYVDACLMINDVVQQIIHVYSLFVYFQEIITSAAAWTKGSC
jgi:hypothetical protein